MQATLSFSIVSDWFSIVLLCITVAFCIAVALRRGVVTEFAIGIPIGMLLVVALFVALHFLDSVPPAHLAATCNGAAR